jgi:hypothetical protein
MSRDDKRSSRLFLLFFEIQLCLKSSHAFGSFSRGGESALKIIFESETPLKSNIIIHSCDVGGLFNKLGSDYDWVILTHEIL